MTIDTPIRTGDQSMTENERQVVAVAAHFFAEHEVAAMAGRIPHCPNAWEQNAVSCFLKTRSELLDIGCGAGCESFALHDAGFEVIGIDISDGQPAHARRTSKESGREITFALCNETTLDFPDSSLDNAVIWAQAPGDAP